MFERDLKPRQESLTRVAFCFFLLEQTRNGGTVRKTPTPRHHGTQHNQRHSINLSSMKKKKSQIGYRHKNGRRKRADAVVDDEDDRDQEETKPEGHKKRHRADAVSSDDDSDQEEETFSGKETWEEEVLESDFEKEDDESDLELYEASEDSDFDEDFGVSEEEEVDEISEIVYLLSLNGKNKMFDNRDTRIAVGVKFQRMGFPNEEHWMGKDGVVSEIVRGLDLPTGSRNMVKRVLEDILECARLNVAYSGSGSAGSGGSNKLILPGSVDEQYICDLIENGVSVGIATLLLNEKRIEAGRDYVGLSAVHSAIERADPDISSVGKLKQGSFDKNSPWAKASYRWVKQLLIRLGKLPSDPSERCFDLSIIGKLVPQQIVSFDEKHVDCIIGQVSKYDLFNKRFRRDANDKLDKNGTLRDPRMEQSVKFKNQGRFLFGVCAIEAPGFGPNNPQFEGKATKNKDYTERTVVTLEDKEKFRGVEIAKVKKDGSKNWIIGRRVKNGEFFEEDPLDMLDRVGEKTVEKLALAEILKVGDLKCLTPDSYDRASSQSGIAVDTISRFVEQAQFAKPGAWKGKIVDCRKKKKRTRRGIR